MDKSFPAGCFFVMHGCLNAVFHFYDYDKLEAAFSGRFYAMGIAFLFFC